jgi:ribosomal protein L7/L12
MGTRKINKQSLSVIIVVAVAVIAVISLVLFTDFTKNSEMGDESNLAGKGFLDKLKEASERQDEAGENPISAEDGATKKEGRKNKVEKMSEGVKKKLKAQQEVEELTEATIVLKEYGVSKIQVIRIVREVTGLGLKDTKELVESAPSIVKENVPIEEAKSIKEKLEKQGATVELVSLEGVEEALQDEIVKEVDLITIVPEIAERHGYLKVPEVEELVREDEFENKVLAFVNARNYIKDIKLGFISTYYAKKHDTCNEKCERFGKKCLFQLGGLQNEEDVSEDKVDIVLNSFGSDKIEIIKIIREITELRLGDTKALVESAPIIVKADTTEEEAILIKERLENAGATASINKIDKVDIVLKKKVAGAGEAEELIDLIDEITLLNYDEARDVVRFAPALIEENLVGNAARSIEEAREIKRRLEGIGAEVEIINKGDWYGWNKEFDELSYLGGCYEGFRPDLKLHRKWCVCED